MTPLSPWFVFILFMMWGIGSLCSCVVRAKRYKKYQRDEWLLTDAIERGLTAFAFIFGSLTLAPHPVASFKWLLVYARYAWLLGFIPFGVGVFLDWYSMARIERGQSK